MKTMHKFTLVLSTLTLTLTAISTPAGTIDSSTYSNRIDLSASPGPGLAVIGDLNGDGKPDLVTWDNAASGFFSIFQNLSSTGGTPAFGPEVDVPLPHSGNGAAYPYIALADMDGDGKLDVVVPFGGTQSQFPFYAQYLYVMRNRNNGGTFDANSFDQVQIQGGSTVMSSEMLAVADIDGDGMPDIVSVGGPTIQVLRNLSTVGNLQFDAPQFYTPNSPDNSYYCLRIADFDGDGKPDIVLLGNVPAPFGGPYHDSIVIVRNTSTPGHVSFAPPVVLDTMNLSYRTMDVGDLNGDGKPDLVVPHYFWQYSVSVYQNLSTPGNIQFAPNVDFFSGDYVIATAIADVDGDGKPDLALAVYTGGTQRALTVLQNMGTPGADIDANYFAPRVMFGGSPSFGAYKVALGDLNGDGLPEAVLTYVDYTGPGLVSVFQNSLLPPVPTISCPSDIAANTDPGQCSALVTFTATASSGATIVCSPASGSSFPKGATTVQCTATKSSGAQAGCSFTVTVNDSEKPALAACPPDLVVATDAGQCSAIVNFTLPEASDNCPGATVSAQPASGSAFPLGTNLVQVTATDTSGNTANCSFNVIVQDKEPPTFVPGSSALLPPSGLSQPLQATNDPGNCYATIAFAKPAVTDNCDASTLTVSVSAVDGSSGDIPLTPVSNNRLSGQFPVGRSVVTVLADDGRGNTNQQQSAVVVTDADPPVITCPADQTVVIDEGQAVNFSQATAVDNCGVQSLVCSPASGALLKPGSNYVVHCAATDIHGLTSMCAFTVSVVAANQPPTANAGADQTVSETSVVPTVQLSGCGSTDDGKPVIPGKLSFHWRQVAGSAVTLSDPTACDPTFSAPLLPAASSQVLTFGLIANDGQLNSAEAFVNITVKNVNQAPQCYASAPAAVAEGSPGIVLNGASSFDPDGDPLVSYAWKQISGPQTIALAGANAATAAFDAPLITTGGGNTNLTQTYVFELTVSDGQLSASARATVVVDNIDHCPSAIPGTNGLVLEDNGYTLDASTSSDPDNDILLYSWRQMSGPAVLLVNPNTASPTFQAPFVNAGGADLIFALMVDDQFGCTDTRNVTVHVDNVGDAPTCVGARASVAELWPPNHKLVPITIANVGTGNRPTTIRITSARQDEPSNGLGDGDIACDAVIATDGASVLLRAERAGTGDGRVYHVYFTATNSEGSCSGQVLVCVPHDQSPGHTCGDGGPIYPSCP